MVDVDDIFMGICLDGSPKNVIFAITFVAKRCGVGYFVGKILALAIILVL